LASARIGCRRAPKLRHAHHQTKGLEGSVDVGRAHAYLSTLEVINDHPWIGTGLASFAAFHSTLAAEFPFPAYGISKQALTTMLEIASEMGMLAGVGLARCIVIAGRGMLTRTSATRFYVL